MHTVESTYNLVTNQNGMGYISHFLCSENNQITI